VLFLEARLEVTSARIVNDKQYWLAAFVYFERTGKQRFKLAASSMFSAQSFPPRNYKFTVSERFISGPHNLHVAKGFQNHMISFRAIWVPEFKVLSNPNNAN
jgi:hypothetical protein